MATGNNWFKLREDLMINKKMYRRGDIKLGRTWAHLLGISTKKFLETFKSKFRVIAVRKDEKNKIIKTTVITIPVKAMTAALDCVILHTEIEILRKEKIRLKELHMVKEIMEIDRRIKECEYLFPSLQELKELRKKFKE